MTTFLRTASRFWKDESGAGAIEYGLIAALVAVVIIAALTSVGTQLTAVFSEVAAKLGATQGGGGTAGPGQ